MDIRRVQEVLGSSSSSSSSWWLREDHHDVPLVVVLVSTAVAVVAEWIVVDFVFVKAWEEDTDDTNLPRSYLMYYDCPSHCNQHHCFCFVLVGIFLDFPLKMVVVVVFVVETSLSSVFRDDDE